MFFIRNLSANIVEQLLLCLSWPRACSLRRRLLFKRNLKVHLHMCAFKKTRFETCFGAFITWLCSLKLYFCKKHRRLSHIYRFDHGAFWGCLMMRHEKNSFKLQIHTWNWRKNQIIENIAVKIVFFGFMLHNFSSSRPEWSISTWNYLRKSVRGQNVKYRVAF